MNLRDSSAVWWDELGQLLAALLAALLLGGLFGLGLWAVLLLLLGYLIWQIYNLYRLERWLAAGGYSARVPESTGVWGEIYERLHQLNIRQRQRQRRLILRLDQFRTSAHALPDATVVLDKFHQIQWFNDAAGHLLGLHYPRDISQRIDNLIRNPRFIAYLQQGVFAGSIDISAPVDLRRHLAIQVVPYGADQLLLVAHEVTERYQIEQLRRDFVANVSHELRTPLTVFTGYLETLSLSQDPALERWQRPIALMREQAERMRRIVGDLLLLAHLESNLLQPRQPMHVTELLRGIRADAQALSGKEQHVVVLYSESDYWLQGAPGEIRSAFANLVFNAVQYTPAGGLITLRWWVDETGAHFSVQDTGVGIDAEHLPRLTERFYRVDSRRSRARGGTGLGLAIVKHVLERYQGQLRVVSEPGKGSCFTCDFPLSLVVAPEDYCP